VRTSREREEKREWQRKVEVRRKSLESWSHISRLPAVQLIPKISLHRAARKARLCSASEERCSAPK